MSNVIDMKDFLNFNTAIPQNYFESTSPWEPSEQVSELKVRLLYSLKSCLSYLLPGGVFQHNKFYVGDVQGNPGQSLVVELEGNRIGMWHDFATGEGGDIISLWAAVTGKDTRSQFPEILTDIAQWSGERTKSVYAMVSEIEKKHEAIQEEEGPELLGAPTARWDYFDEANKLIACVYRYETDSGKQYRPWDVKTCRNRAPNPRPLYNIPGILKAKTVVLVEGEKSADSLMRHGITATTAMFGANAPIDKTDWEPLKNKHVIIWPDHDEPGRQYADKVSLKLKNLGVASIQILQIPENKPKGYDAADSDAEGVNLDNFIDLCPKKTISVNKMVPAFTLGQLLQDDSPMPYDVIAPRIVTPGGLLIFGGAPKVGKSDFLISWLVHMAAGIPFLEMKPAKPLKIFYLQTEIGYHYLRERLKQLELAPDLLEQISNNLVITPQTRMLLNDEGIAQIVQTISDFFDPKTVDLIVIDPLRNIFDAGDHGTENDNNAMLFFLQERLERLRHQVNPNAGMIVAHHTKKITKKLLEEDPFQSLSGAGALRGFYTTGMILFRPDETKTPRQLMFELRNGERIDNKWVDKMGGKWSILEEESQRLVNKHYGEKLDAERRRKHDIILQLIYDEARKGKLYTASQFCRAFENRSGLGGQHSIRDRIDVLSTKGYIKFCKTAARKSKYGFLCVEAMDLKETKVDPETGEETTHFQPILPTHYKSAEDGAIIHLENPSLWFYHD